MVAVWHKINWNGEGPATLISFSAFHNVEEAIKLIRCSHMFLPSVLFLSSAPFLSSVLFLSLVSCHLCNSCGEYKWPSHPAPLLLSCVVLWQLSLLDKPSFSSPSGSFIISQPPSAGSFLRALTMGTRACVIYDCSLFVSTINPCNLKYFENKIKYGPAHDKTYKKTCARSEDSDQPVHPRSLVRPESFADRMCLLQPPGYLKWNKWNPLPYWVDIQDDLRFCWLHTSDCRFCQALAHISQITICHHENIPI